MKISVNQFICVIIFWVSLRSHNIGLKKASAKECPALGSSVDTRNDPVANSSAVFVPRRAVFPPALTHVAGISVQKQDDEVDHVVPWQEVAKAAG